MNVETVRFYEREGLLPEPPRTAAGYRQYSEVDRWRLAFIRRAKTLGFSLLEIGELFGTGGERSVSEVHRLAATRLARVQRDLDELTARRDQLRLLLEVCESGSDDDCLELLPSGPDTAGRH